MGMDHSINFYFKVDVFIIINWGAPMILAGTTTPDSSPWNGQFWWINWSTTWKALRRDRVVQDDWGSCCMRSAFCCKAAPHGARNFLNLHLFLFSHCCFWFSSLPCLFFHSIVFINQTWWMSAMNIVVEHLIGGKNIGFRGRSRYL